MTIVSRVASTARRRLPLVEVAPSACRRTFVREAEFLERLGEATPISGLYAGKYRNFLLLDFRNQRFQNAIVPVARCDRSVGHMDRIAVPKAPFEVVPPHQQRSDDRFIFTDGNRREARYAARHELAQYALLLRLALEIEWDIGGDSPHQAPNLLEIAERCRTLRQFSHVPIPARTTYYVKYRDMHRRFKLFPTHFPQRNSNLQKSILLRCDCRVCDNCRARN